MKRCSQCGEVLILTAFGKDSHAPSGLRYACKACVNAQSANYRIENPETSRESQRKYREANPEKRKAGWNAWYALNADHVAEGSRQRRADNPEWWRAYKASHRLQSASYEQKRRAVKADALVDDVQHEVVFVRDKGTCGICSLLVNPTDWHLDHVVPLSRSGEHSYANTRVSHPACNDWKFNRLDEELPPIPLRILTAARADSLLAA